MRVRWPNVWVIFSREVRDQIRDRRTLFMIFVLPIMLYPLLGYGVVAFTAAFEQKPRTVLVVGAEHLPEQPPLLNPQGDGFAAALFDTPDETTRLKVTRQGAEGPWLDPNHRKLAVRAGLADAVVA